MTRIIDCGFCLQVKVMLRVSSPSNASPQEGSPGGSSFFNLDKRKKQVTLYDPGVSGVAGGGTTAPEDRRVGVAAPKMFAFDAIFSQDDSQVSFPFHADRVRVRNIKLKIMPCVHCMCTRTKQRRKGSNGGGVVRP